MHKIKMRKSHCRQEKHRMNELLSKKVPFHRTVVNLYYCENTQRSKKRGNIRTFRVITMEANSQGKVSEVLKKH